MLPDQQFDAIVRYRGDTCRLTCTNARVDITPQHQPTSSTGFHIPGVNRNALSLTRQAIVGAERVSPMLFKIHYVCRGRQSNPQRIRLRKTYQIDCGQGTAEDMVENVRRLALRISPNEMERGRPHVLFIVNPKSGKGQAKNIYFKKVRPFVRTVLGWRCTEHVTESQDDGKGLIRSIDRLTNYAMIAVLGGDGTVHEVLQGLLMRDDWRECVRIPIVPIPAGSGNALATSIGIRDIDTALFAMSKIQTQQMDILAIENKEGRIYSFLGVMYGALSDIDVGSEKLRWLGGLRFAIGAMKEIVMMKSFSIKIAYLPIDEKGTPNRPARGGKSPIELPPLSKDDPSTSERFGVNQTEPELPKRLQTLETSLVSQEVLEWFSASKEVKTGPRGWVLSDNRETRLMAALNIPYIAKDCHLIPEARVSDGALHLLQAPTSSMHRRQMFKLFRKSKTGEHLTLPGIDYSKIKALLFRPVSGKSWLTVDGEIVASNLISVEVLPSLISIISVPSLTLVER